jgi:hypothetical protein
MGWAGVKNGALLALAASQAFEAMITTDKGMPHQQNPAALPLAVVILDAPTNDLADLSPLVPDLLVRLTKLQPRSVARVGPKP